MRKIGCQVVDRQKDTKASGQWRSYVTKQEPRCKNEIGALSKLVGEGVVVGESPANMYLHNMLKLNTYQHKYTAVYRPRLHHGFSTFVQHDFISIPDNWKPLARMVRNNQDCAKLGGS